MKLRDVPLSFLPTFEAAGRLGSFAAAAAELHLTPSAISQQIRALEDVLGVTLFERTGRSALLTAAGERYLVDVRQSLQELSAATARLQRRTHSSVLRLSTVSIAAHEFLLPRMSQFQARFPEILLHIESTNQVVDFKTSDFDAAIRFGEGWPDLTIHRLGRVELAPVCSVALASELRSVADLSRYCLLDPSGVGENQLRRFQTQSGAPQQPPVRCWRFETCFESLRAAEHGLGVAFAVFPIATPWVTSGRVAVPLAERVACAGHVSFVYRPCDAERFPFHEIAAWLAAEFAALTPLASGRIVPTLAPPLTVAREL